MTGVEILAALTPPHVVSLYSLDNNFDLLVSSIHNEVRGGT